MKQHVRLVLCVVGAGYLVVAASSIQAQVKPEPPLLEEPLWAYAWSTQPKPGDKAIPQAVPTRALRPNEDPQEQTKPRTVPGSAAA